MAFIFDIDYINYLNRVKMSVTFKEELKDIMVKQINGLTDVIVEAIGF